MFNVPVTYVSPYINGLKNPEVRQRIYHEFAANGARHMVLTCALARMMLADEAVVQEVLVQLDQEGLDFVDAHAPFGELLDMNCPVKTYRPRMLAHQKRMIELCAQLGIRTLTIHVGNNLWIKDPEMRKLEYNRACIEDTLEHLLPVAEANGVIICIENIWFNTNTPEELLRYKELFPTDALGFCYDAGHANIMRRHPGKKESEMLWFWREIYGQEPAYDDHVLEKMLPHIVNCHLHDNDGLIDQHVNPGMGDIPWEKIIPVLKTAPRLQCVQSEVDSGNRCVAICDVVRQFNWLGSL